MAKQWIGTGSSVDDAVLKGLKELKLSRENVIVSVLEERTSGLLSMMGFKRVRVRLSEKVAGQPAPNPNQGRIRDRNEHRHGGHRERSGGDRDRNERSDRGDRNDRGDRDRNDRDRNERRPGGGRHGQNQNQNRRPADSEARGDQSRGNDSRDARDSNRDNRDARDNRGNDNRDTRDNAPRDGNRANDARDNRGNDNRGNEGRGQRGGNRDRGEGRSGGRSQRGDNRDNRDNRGGDNRRQRFQPQQRPPHQPPQAAPASQASQPTPMARLEATASLSEDERALVEEFTQAQPAQETQSYKESGDFHAPASETAEERDDIETDNAAVDAEMEADADQDDVDDEESSDIEIVAKSPQAAPAPSQSSRAKSAPVNPADLLTQFKTMTGWDDLAWTIQEVPGRRLKIELATSRSAQLMGRQGEGIDAFEYLFNLIFSRRWEGAPYAVFSIAGESNEAESFGAAQPALAPEPVESVENTEAQNETIIRAAKAAAAEVRRSGRMFRLDPMESNARRLVHQTLAEEPGIETASEGEGPFRKVVVKPKKK
jgi:predicted RNA-binding protein Jag